ncbi:MAG: hypothetical protein WKF76_06160 [Nocardioidaceae bacterium]
MDAVVHLAGIPTEASLPDDPAQPRRVDRRPARRDGAARRRRMVYASSNHAVGMTPRTDLLPTSTSRPAGHVLRRGQGRCARRCSACTPTGTASPASPCRIGSFLERPTSRRNLATWLSLRRLRRHGARRALTAELEGYTPIYGISANSDGWWDLEPGRALGYHPTRRRRRLCVRRRPPP